MQKYAFNSASDYEQSTGFRALPAVYSEGLRVVSSARSIATWVSLRAIPATFGIAQTSLALLSFARAFIHLGGSHLGDVPFLGFFRFCGIDALHGFY